MRRNYCRSILLLGYPASHSLWINLWTRMVSELSCHLWEATIVWTPALSVVYICVCWPLKRGVYTITSLLLQHRRYLLLLCCLHYQPSQGVTLFTLSRVSPRISIKGREPLGHSSLGLALGLGSRPRRVRAHIIFHGGSFLLARPSADVHFCGGVCFCWSCWGKHLLEVCIESTRLLLGLD